MHTEEEQPESRLRRAVSDIVVAEMFLLQATVESFNAISDGISDVSRSIYWNESAEDEPQPIKSVYRRTRTEVIEAYTSRFDYLRRLIGSDS